MDLECDDLKEVHINDQFKSLTNISTIPAAYDYAGDTTMDN